MRNTVLLPLLKRPRVVSLLVLVAVLGPLPALISPSDRAHSRLVEMLLRADQLVSPIAFWLSVAIGLVLSLAAVELKGSGIVAVVPRMARGLRTEIMTVMAGWALVVSALSTFAGVTEPSLLTLIGMTGLGLATGWAIADRRTPWGVTLGSVLILMTVWLNPYHSFPWLARRPSILLALVLGLVGATVWRWSRTREGRSKRPLTLHEITLMTAYLDKPVGTWLWPERRFSVAGSATTARALRSAAAFESIGMLRGGQAALVGGIQTITVFFFIVVPVVVATTWRGANGVSELFAALTTATPQGIGLSFWWCWTIGLTDTPRLARDRLVPVSRRGRFHIAYSAALRMHLAVLLPGLLMLGTWVFLLSWLGDTPVDSLIESYSPGLLLASGLAPLAQWLSATGQSTEPRMTLARLVWWTLCAAVVYFSTGAVWCSLFSSADLLPVLSVYGVVVIGGQLVFHNALRKHFATSDLVTPLR